MSVIQYFKTSKGYLQELLSSSILAQSAGLKDSLESEKVLTFLVGLGSPSLTILPFLSSLGTFDGG